MPKIFILLIMSLSFGFALPLVSVSIPPQKYFVEKIAGKSVQINVIIPTNTDEHNFDLKPATMQKLEKSDIYFGIGLELEKNLIGRFQSIAKNLRFIDTGKDLRNLANSHEDSHAHDKSSHEHSHAHSKDPHIWLDPILVKTQAELIAKALTQTYPQNKALYEANLAKFQAELDALHAQISALLASKRGKKFITYHPSWSYFAARYKLVQIPVEFEGKEPKAKHLQELINTAKKEQISTIFIQKGFPQNAANSLAKELNASVVEINHLSEQWQDELLKTAQILGR